jgi:hypothetical protein
MSIAPASRGDSAARRSPGESASLGLAFLFQQQNFDGSFGPRDRRAGTTGLALLAFFAAGNTDDGGRYAADIHRALEYLARESTPQSAGNEDQAIVALTLCEAYGVESDETFRQRMHAIAERSLKNLLAAQLKDGGWGAQAGDAKSGPLASAWSAMALQSAVRIGLIVPKENLDRAHAYVEQLSKRPKPATTEPAIMLDDDSYFEVSANDRQSHPPAARRRKLERHCSARNRWRCALNEHRNPHHHRSARPVAAGTLRIVRRTKLCGRSL